MNILQHKPAPVSVAAKGGLKGYQRDPGSGVYHDDGINVNDWRGHGGRHPTYSSVEFDRQLDKVSMWLEKWNHTQRCQIIEIILRRSNHIQFQFLFTVMQPSLHRDFIYNAQSYFPSMDFKSISTPAVRESQSPRNTKTILMKKRKLRLYRQDNYFREKSAYLRQDAEAKHFAHETKTLKLPHIPTGTSLQTGDKSKQDISTMNYKSKHKNLSSSPTTFPRIQQSVTLPKYHKFRGSDGLERLHPDGVQSLASSTPVMRFVDMPVRRHIQDEGKMNYLGTSLMSVNSPSSLSVSLPSPESSRQRKRDPFTRDHGGSGAFSKDSQPMQKVNRLDDGLDDEARYVIQWYDDWSDLRRNEFLHKLMLKLDQRQHFFLSSFLSVRQHRDFLALLPEDISLKILNYLSPNKILKCCLVSKTWYRLASSNLLWEWKCQEREILVPIPHVPWWKKIFRDNVQLISNWKTGSCRKLDLRGHTEQVEEIAFTHRILASGSQDKTIKIWDLKTGQNLMTLRGHEKGVWCLNFFTDSLLVSGSYDGTIKIWNLRNGQTAKTLLAHDGPVWAMVRHQEILVTASQDKTAKVWNIAQCLLKATLLGHSAAVFAVDMNEDGSLVITGSADRTVRLWSTETGVQKKVIWVSQTTSVMAVSYSEGYIACSYGETICLYRVEKTKLLRTYQEHHKRIEALELKIKTTDDDFDSVTGTLISAGQDGMVKYWDLQQSSSTRTFKGHVGSVKAIRFDNLRIASAASDKVRIWDFTFYEKTEKVDRSEKSQKFLKVEDDIEFKSETARSSVPD